MTDLMREQLATPNKYEGLGSAGQKSSFATTTAELVIGFWPGIGAILAIRMVNSLDYCIEELKAENKVTINKMAEQTYIQQDLKKVEAGNGLAEWNHRNR